MSRADHDYLFLKSLQKILLKEESTPVQIISELYKALYGDQHPPRPQWKPLIEKWESVVIARAILLAAEIVAKYVQLFYDPKSLPVTHYWKQKQVALLLDEHFSTVMWDAIKRSGTEENGFNIYEELEADDFLDKPILFLKQEARDRVFWNLKNNIGLLAIRDRFLEKVKSSGVHLEKLERDSFHSL